MKFLNNVRCHQPIQHSKNKEQNLNLLSIFYYYFLNLAPNVGLGMSDSQPNLEQTISRICAQTSLSIWESVDIRGSPLKHVVLPAASIHT